VPVDADLNQTQTAEAEVADAGDVVAGDRVSPEQLCDYLARASFATTFGRRGYQQDDVDAFLLRLADSVREGEPLRDLVRRTRLATVRLEDGYDTGQVDGFLAAVVDLDPHGTAEPPVVGRSGLVGRLFG
jgi:DivIVA domain-containing protein